MDSLRAFYNDHIVAFFNMAIVPLLGQIILALLIVVAGRWLTQWLSGVLLRLMRRSRLDETLTKFLHNISYWFLLIAVWLFAIQTVGVPIPSVLAVIGAAGLAVGLALKDSLANFAAGVMIIVFRPFKAGDAITAAGQSGTVEEIGIFCTLLTTADNQRIIIPNASITSSIIVNTSALPTRRVDLLFTVSFTDNLAVAKQTIEAVLKQEARLLAEPAASIGVERLTDNGVELFARPWVKSADYGVVRTALIEQIKTALEAAGMVTPYRQQTLHVHHLNSPQQS